MQSNYKNFHFLPFYLSISVLALIISLLTGNISFILAVSLTFSLICILFQARSFHLVLLNFFILLFPLDYTIGLISGEPFYPFYRFDKMPLVFFLISIVSISFLCFRMKRETYYFSFNLELYKSKYIVRALMLLSLILTLSIKGNVALFIGEGSYSTYQENLRSGSGIIEYTLMIFISCLFYKKSKIEYYVLLSIIILYCFKMTLLGFRVQSLVSIIIITFLIFKKNPSAKINILLCFFGFLFMLIYGVLKEGGDIFQNGLSFNLLVDTRYGYIQSHQHGVLSSSSIILSYTNHELIKILYIPAAFLVSILPKALIGSQLEFMYPSIYIQNFQYTPGGGFFTVQLYSLLGFGGVLFFLAILIITFRNFCSINCNKFFLVISITFLCFFPRWISYDFLNFGLRTVLIVSVLVHLPYYLKLSRIC